MDFTQYLFDRGVKNTKFIHEGTVQELKGKVYEVDYISPDGSVSLTYTDRDSAYSTGTTLPPSMTVRLEQLCQDNTLESAEIGATLRKGALKIQSPEEGLSSRASPFISLRRRP